MFSLLRNLLLLTVITSAPINLLAQKNVLFLMADDYNYYAKCIGYKEEAVTPTIDALAAKGVLFTAGLSSSPVCNPSRNAIWSGYRPATTGISDNQGGYFRTKPGFANVKSMNQYFKENAYYVLGAGKLYHNGSMTGSEVDAANWSELITDGTGCNGGSFKKYTGTTTYNTYIWSHNTTSMNTTNCGDNNVATKIANKIATYHTSANKDKPFFIGCGLFRPHAPFNSTQHYWEKISDTDIKPGKGVLAKDLDKTTATGNQYQLLFDGVYNDAIHSYLACMAMTDDNIKIVLDALEASPYKDNTIVCFMGDHGFDLGEQGRWGKFAKTRSANNTTLIIYDPSSKGNGKVCNVPVTLQDLYPTLVELCGLPAKKDIEGVSLKYLLDNPSGEAWPHPAVMTYSDQNYIMTKDWYFIEDGAKSLLFNNNTDPYQWTNVFNVQANAATVASMRAKIDSTLAIGTRMKSDLISTGKVSDKNLNPQQPIVTSILAKYTPKLKYLQNSIVGNDRELKLNLLYSDPSVQIDIYSSNGTLILSRYEVGELEDVTITLPSTVVPGSYLVRINNDNHPVTEKFIVVN